MSNDEASVDWLGMGNGSHRHPLFSPAWALGAGTGPQPFSDIWEAGGNCREPL